MESKTTLVKWLAQYNKAFVSILMVLVYLVNREYGIELPVTDETATAILGMVISVITYLVPNKQLK